MSRFLFNNKTVYIISPESWGGMKVSKHHYALELAAQNCKVFFIQPPILSNNGIEIISVPENPLINIVKYKPIFRGKRFLPGIIFSWLVKLQAKALVKAIGLKPDVVWSFQGYLFEDLRNFKSPVNIFFAADQFLYDALPGEIASSDLSLAVSDSIYERMKQSVKKVFQLNHGLQEAFVEKAKKLLEKKNRKDC